LDNEVYPVKSTLIKGATATAFAIMRAPKENIEITVKDAIEAGQLRKDPENIHHCPLCSEFFMEAEFFAHAPQCAQLRAPRKHIWTPPGWAKGASQHFKDKIKPDFVVEAERVKAQMEKER
jgi:hypothetical protein